MLCEECLVSFNRFDDISAITSCGHCFHTECIASIQNQCPYCFEVLSEPCGIIKLDVLFEENSQENEQLREKDDKIQSLEAQLKEVLEESWRSDAEREETQEERFREVYEKTRKIKNLKKNLQKARIETEKLKQDFVNSQSQNELLARDAARKGLQHEKEASQKDDQINNLANQLREMIRESKNLRKDFMDLQIQNEVLKLDVERKDSHQKKEALRKDDQINNLKSQIQELRDEMQQLQKDITDSQIKNEVLKRDTERKNEHQQNESMKKDDQINNLKNQLREEIVKARKQRTDFEKSQIENSVLKLDLNAERESRRLRQVERITLPSTARSLLRNFESSSRELLPVPDSFQSQSNTSSFSFFDPFQSSIQSYSSQGQSRTTSCKACKVGCYNGHCPCFRSGLGCCGSCGCTNCRNPR